MNPRQSVAVIFVRTSGKILHSKDTMKTLLRLLYRLQPKSNKPNINNQTGEFDKVKAENNFLTVANIELGTVNVMIATVELGLGKKVASAAIENFKSTAILQKTGDVSLDGKIGSINLLDLESEETNSNRIFALGDSRVPDEEFASIFKKSSGESDAFNFEFRREQTGQNQHDLILNLDTASLCYLHSPKFLAAFLACIDQFKVEFAVQLTADAQRMYQAVMDGLYQRVADFAKGPTQLSIFKMNLNFESPYVALPKHPFSNEFLFGQLGRISIQNSGLENYSIAIEQASVNSLLKHSADRIDDRGEILNGTDLNIHLGRFSN